MTHSNDRQPRLPRRAEALLDDWPAPSRGALAWEENASTVMARVRDIAVGSTPDDLLAAPFPEEPDEVGRVPEAESDTAVSRPSEKPAADEPSLADIARGALSASEAARKEVARDGLLAAELGRKNPPRDLTPGPVAVQSAKVAGLQGRITRVSEPAARPAPPRVVPMAAVPAEAAPAPVSEASARSEMPPALGREPRRFNITLAGSVLAMAAAAALFVFTRGSEKSAPVMASAEAERPAVVAQAPSLATPAPTNTAMTESPSAAEPAASTMIALDQLPTLAKRKALSPDSSGKTLAFHMKKEEAKNAGKIVLEEKEDAPEQNAPPVAQAAQAAPPPAETLMQQPSTGAVQAAFGPVLMGARSCLAGQDAGPRATVTFDGKSGRVKSVVLDGPGAGTPAESCVRTALMGARLPPFADSTFTASVTVRPL